jgi:hypothetical protein
MSVKPESYPGEYEQQFRVEWERVLGTRAGEYKEFRFNLMCMTEALIRWHDFRTKGAA